MFSKISTRRMLACLLVVAMLSCTLLAGCTPTQGGDNPATTTTAVTTTVGDGDTVTTEQGDGVTTDTQDGDNTTTDGNGTTADKGGNNTTADKGGNNTTADKGGNGTTADKGGNNTTTNNKGGNNTTTNNKGGNNTTTNNKGGSTTTVNKPVNNVTTKPVITTVQQGDVTSITTASVSLEYKPNINVAASQQMTITSLQTDSRHDPVGIDYTAPEFSWILESSRRGAKQTYYRVGVASSRDNIVAGNFDVWDSGKVQSADTTITYGAVNGTGGKKAATLKARTRYYWTVYAWNENSVENRSSQIGMFETALFGDFGSANQWIMVQGTNDLWGSSLFRRQFTLSQPLKNVKQARLYSTAAGNQVMYMNGKKVSDDYFAPGFSKYTTQLYYQTYDVTEFLLSGDNTVGAEVGMGWYNAGAVGCNYGTNIALKAKLIVTYNDGTEQVIDTDGKWQGTREGHTTENQFYKGQTIDGNEYIQGWCENNCTSSKWKTVHAVTSFNTLHGAIADVFVAENMEPVRCIQTMKPSEAEKKSSRATLYRFNQNVVGTVRVKAKAKAGVVMTLKYGEYLTEWQSGNWDEGSLTGTEYLGHNGIDQYTFRGDEEGETVTFDLVYHGFQFVLLENASTGTLRSEKIEILSIEALVLSSDMDVTYSLETSNSKINQYIKNVLWSLRGNFVSTLTDCPTREKNTWTGDAQIFAAASSYYADTYNHYRNLEEVIRHSQSSDGVVQETMPGFGGGGTTANAPAGWSDAVVIIPWEMYNQFGDVQIIKDNYDAMKKWVDYVAKYKVNQSTYKQPYFIKDMTDVRVDGTYGDWLLTGGTGSYYEMSSSNNQTLTTRVISLAEIGTAYAAYSSSCLSKMAAAIGKTADAQYYDGLYKRFAAAWRKNFVAEDGYTCTSAGTTTLDKNGNPVSYTAGQGWYTSYAMGIMFDLYETEELKQKAAQKLANLLKSNEYAQQIGFIGMNLIYPALSWNGQFDTAMKMMEREELPSLLYMVTQGATTIWETYRGEDYSYNHYVFGAPSRWLFTDVLGISHGYESGNVGYTHFNLQPTYASYSGATVTNVKGSYTARTGTIKAEWNVSSDRKTFTYNCTVPANTTATLALPVSSASATITEGGKAANSATGVKYVKTENGRAYYELQSGTYNFVVKN